MGINVSRHLSIINPYDYPLPIHIVGVGATGSRLFTALVELGFTNITVHDFDVVESHNLANQVYNVSDIGKLKVDALKDWVNTKLGEDIKTINYSSDALPAKGVTLSGYVFLLIDTMAGRKQIYEECIKDNYGIEQVFETRMASSYGDIYTFNPLTQGQEWFDTLIDDDDAEVSSCGASISVGTTASIIANMCVWQFMLSLTDESSAEGIVHLFLKPFCMGGESWKA